MRTYARELVALQPDVIFAGSPEVASALQAVTGTIPIVFRGGTPHRYNCATAHWPA
jgi:ABC-type uncharacterized transport system substrate-binding protein